MRTWIASLAAAVALGTTASARAASLETISVEGFGDASVVVPDGEGVHPLVVALHGHRGRADWSCAIASDLAPDAFVVCPEGIASPRTASDRGWDRFTYASVEVTKRETDAAIAAVTRAFGGRVDATKPVLYGHSLGAIFGASIAAREPSRFSALVLSEGGAQPIAAAARAFASSATRVLFACGTASCRERANGASATLRRAGASAEVVYVAGAGHHSYGPIVGAMASHFETLVAHDARFLRHRS